MPTFDDHGRARSLLLAIAVAALVADPARLPPRGRPQRAAAGDRAVGRPRLGRRPLDADRASPATTSSPASPRATTASPRPRAPQPRAAAGSSRRSSRPRPATAPEFVAGRAADRRPGGVRHDRLRRPARRPARRSRPRRRPRRVRCRSGPSSGSAARQLGVLVGHLPATRPLGARRPGPARAVRERDRGRDPQRPAVRAGRGPERASSLELDAAKDDFLRGVSHNLQTPLTSIRAYADQLATRPPDRRLEIIAEQADRLSRMVRQLLTVTPARVRRAAAAERGRVALAPRVRRTWEALGVERRRRSRSTTGPTGWLAIADADQLDQVLWALLDNAVKYGERIAGRGRRSGSTRRPSACG